MIRSSRLSSTLRDCLAGVLGVGIECTDDDDGDEVPSHLESMYSGVERRIQVDMLSELFSIFTVSITFIAHIQAELAV